MSKEIKLSRGLVAIVDDADFDWLNQWKWSALKVGKKAKKFYAVRMAGKKMVLMHRLIAGAHQGVNTDHKDGNSLDNQRHNLRLCNQSQNTLNASPHKDKVGSKFKGVHWHRQRRKFVAEFRGKYIGIFADEIQAARAYDAAATKHSPEFARTNFSHQEA